MFYVCHAAAVNHGRVRVAAKDQVAELRVEWGQQYPAIVRLEESSLAELGPILEYDVENPAASLHEEWDASINARYRRAGRHTGSSPRRPRC